MPDDAQAEWDSPETIAAVRNALEERHEVFPIDAGKDAYAMLQKTRPDIVFNLAEGTIGPCREGFIPSILEHLKIPYTASDPLTLNTCLDKARTKEILAYYGLATSRFHVIYDRNSSSNGLVYPLMVKPLHEGSSKGIRDNSLVNNKQEMAERIAWLLDLYNEPAIIEEFLPGREFTVAILGNGNEARVLPIVEIRFDSLPPGVNPIYSYEAKWIWDQSSNPLRIFDCPAVLTAELQADIESACLQAYNLLRCRDWCRIDVRLDAAGRPHILELNPLPGILPRPEDNSCFPKAARAAGMPYNKLINTVLDIACKRCGLEQ
jgi:D-alanine-D-alanine ligase